MARDNMRNLLNMTKTPCSGRKCPFATTFLHKRGLLPRDRLPSAMALQATIDTEGQVQSCMRQLVHARTQTREIRATASDLHSCCQLHGIEVGFHLYDNTLTIPQALCPCWLPPASVFSPETAFGCNPRIHNYFPQVARYTPAPRK